MNAGAVDSLGATRRWIWKFLGYLALAAAPFFLALLVFGVKFQGLRTTSALEQAQLARQLAAGEGFTTRSIRPLALAFRPELEAHPDLYHAPAYPLFLALPYSIAKPSDRTTAAAGMGLWIVLLFLTFLVARRHFGPGVAVLAVVFTMLNAALLRGSLYGLPFPLAAIFVLLAAALAAPPPEAAPPAGWRLAAAGAFCGLAALTHYALLGLVPALGLAMAGRGGRKKGRSFLLFALGLLVVGLPWMWRNARLTGSPLFSLYWFEAMAGTASYPGDSVWRATSFAATRPLGFLFLEPMQVARKVLGGLALFWQEALHVVDPAVGFLSLAALLGGLTEARRRGWFAAAAAGAGLCILVSCLLRPEPELLLAWVPLMAIAAAGFLRPWLADAVERISLRRAWQMWIIPFLFRRPEHARRAIHAALLALALAVVGFPLFIFLGISRPEPHPFPPQAVAAIQRHVPPQATVMTDQPAVLAWYAGRRSLWLCLSEEDWDSVERRGRTIDATFVTPAVASIAPRDAGHWWWWIASPRGVYRKLAPVEPMPPMGILRVRGP